MYFVYRIRSEPFPDQSFIGTSRDVKKRLRMHNSGMVAATREGKPWRLSFYIAFNRKQRAHAFEDFLKSPAGKHFGRKYLWQHIKDPDLL